MRKKILFIDAADKSFELKDMDLSSQPFSGGEALCQFLIREDRDTLALAVGDLPFFPGNKLTVGYVSPLTALPHYSFVGGRAAEQVMALGLGAILFKAPREDVPPWYVVIEGREPDIRVRWQQADGLPRGQRSALYWLLERELDSDWTAGSIMTLGDAAYHGYRSANLAVEGIYHAGRGGAGYVLGRMAMALVLKGESPPPTEVLGKKRFDELQKLLAKKISPLLKKHCARLGRPDTGTIVKLPATGNSPDGRNTLPARNARDLGYAAADLGAGRTLLATRDGHAACQWCEVRCRHWHWVPADYAPDGVDAFLDDFEPAYAVCAMLDLKPRSNDFAGLKQLRKEVDEKLFLPIEQLGCDVMDVGIGMAALFEGLERGIIPREDVPDFLRGETPLFGDMEAASSIIEAMREGSSDFPAIAALGDGPQRLVARYPEMKDLVFTCGRRTLGNAGHCNALWTFAMPLSHFFSHYSGQIYKIDENLPSDVTDDEARKVFARVVQRMLKREMICAVANNLSFCAFVFAIFTEEGKGEEFNRPLLAEVLDLYGLDLPTDELQKRAETFLAQSIRLRQEMHWRPPTPSDYPRRVFEALSKVMDQPVERCAELFGLLIDEWKQATSDLLKAHGHEAAW